MMLTKKFLSDKATLRAELERQARFRRTVTYGEAGHLVRWPAGGLGAILAAIRAEEAERGRPDLTVLVVLMTTGLPNTVKPGAEARDRAIAVQEAVFAAWADRT